MNYFVLLILVFPLVQSHSGSYKDFLFDKCSIEKKSCEIHKDNLIGSFVVTNLEEYQQRFGSLENIFHNNGGDGYSGRGLEVLKVI